VPTLALSPRLDVVRRCQIYWGVHALQREEPHETPELLEMCAEAVMGAGFAAPGDKVGLTAGLPAGMSGGTNLFKVHTLE
jgi:pyruvate kinase